STATIIGLVMLSMMLLSIAMETRWAARTRKKIAIQEFLFNIENLIDCRIHPCTTFLQQIDELIHSHLAIYISLHHFLSFVKSDLANATAHVAKVGIGHFTRTIHYATHDCNLHTLEVIGDRSDLRSCLLQI